MQVIACTEAKAKGFKTYFTGKPCPRGHLAARYLSGKCQECDREFNRQPYRRERARQYSAKWRADPANKAKKIKQQKKWCADPVNKERRRKKLREREGFPKPTRAEPDFCEICGRITARALALDHCHQSGKFRGWLCTRCNVGLGLFGDSVDELRKAVSYLEKNG